MRVIARQFTKEILLASFFVLLALLGLFAFFDLVGQLDNVGSGSRTMSQAFLLTALILPIRAYQLMPLAALLAAVYTMARWSSSSEYTVLRVAGLSPQRMASFLLVPAVMLVGLTYFFGEVVAPPAERYSLEVKSSVGNRSDNLTARGFSSGVWVRDTLRNENGQEVIRYINVSYIKASDQGSTGGWRVFEVDSQGHLLALITSESGHYVPDQGWELRGVNRIDYPLINPRDNRPTEAAVRSLKSDSYMLQSSFGPNTLGVMTVKPDEMSMSELRQYITHLEKNNQSTERYEVAFWNKAYYPLGTLVMIALSLPFAYMNSRSGGVAIKIFFGVMIGIVYYALNNVFSYLGVLDAVSPMILCAIPTTGMLLVAALALYWVERR